MNRKRHSHHRTLSHRKFSVALATSLAFMVAAGIGGYFLATSRDADALLQNRSAVDAARYQVLAATDESLCQRIERINIEQQAREQAKVITQLKGEVDGVQKTILDALT